MILELYSTQKIAFEQEKLKASSLSEKLRDILEDQKLSSAQSETIQKTLNEKILYLNEKINGINKKNEELMENSMKESQEKNSIISSLMKKLEVFSFFLIFSYFYWFF